MENKMKNYKGQKIDDCAYPEQMDKKDIEEIVGDFLGTIVGFRCKVCQGWWKVYQNESHTDKCKYKNRNGE